MSILIKLDWLLCLTVSFASIYVFCKVIFAFLLVQIFNDNVTKINIILTDMKIPTCPKYARPDQSPDHVSGSISVRYSWMVL